MTIYEFISIFISVISFIVAYRAHTLSSSAGEISLRSLVENGRNEVNALTAKMAHLLALKENNSLTEVQAEELNIYTGLFKSAVESWLNTYEEACAKYIDNKIDKKRFKKQYHTEIRNLVEEEEFEKFFNPTKSKFQAILKVHKEWNNLEK